MALSITVHGQGTFTASMEEGPVTFTASIGSVGPQGATGPTGPAGVVSATAPITYDSGTQTVGISATPTFTSVTATTGNITTVNLTTATFADATSQTTAFVGEARKVYVTARNSTGSTIAAGKVVYLSGATGNKPTIALAQANAEGTSARVIGITVESIANNADGKVITSGVAENIDTSAFTAGDVVYLSATTAGGMTTTLPTQPYHGVAIGIVTRANPSVGSVEVQINNYQELEELSDVSVADRANNDGLFWESSSSTWRSKTVAEVLGYTPIQLSSLSASSPLAYNNTSGEFSINSSSTDYSSLMASTLGLPTYAGSPQITVNTAGTNTILGRDSLYAKWFTGSEVFNILGLGTMATETAANYALLASPTFTGDPKAPTPATSDNDTSIATTAFVNAYCPAASTSTAGKVQLATDTQARAGTSTTLIPTVSGVDSTITDTGRLWLVPSQFTAVTSGTGATTGLSYNSINCTAPTSATGYATRYYSMLFRGRGQNYNAAIDWSKRTEFNFGFQRGSSPTDSNCVFRVVFGKASFSGVAGDPSARAIGIKITASGNYAILAHNGTSLTTYATSTASSTTYQQLKLVSDGAGNVELFVNGTSAGSTTGGPTSAGASGLNNAQLECENLSSITGTAASAYIANVNAHFAE